MVALATPYNRKEAPYGVPVGTSRDLMNVWKVVVS